MVMGQVRLTCVCVVLPSPFSAMMLCYTVVHTNRSTTHTHNGIDQWPSHMQMWPTTTTQFKFKYLNLPHFQVISLNWNANICQCRQKWERETPVIKVDTTWLAGGMAESIELQHTHTLAGERTQTLITTVSCLSCHSLTLSLSLSVPSILLPPLSCHAITRFI